ncbi:hypothetical protein [Proteiniclasticum sp.]|uniref:hypothetical protein n=1 Tax=Proteiniclasticum sp. TaxID=2053595 RepID=UPI00289DE65F|nr:hypothetical protein [Proteiniclasticum sp.]
MSFENGRFVIENYHMDSVFSSFLPGISGKKGIPIWCYYVNRGQAVASFGTENKDHSIMEFYPAHQSYQIVSTMGFRSFLKIDGVYYEPFSDDSLKRRMLIGMNDLEIEETNEKLGLKVSICYYTLPEEKLGGLVREMRILDLSGKARKLELADGMPAVIPYGIDLNELKETGQTMKAWMQVEDTEKKLPYYRVRISTKDSAVVSLIERGNYYLSLGPHHELLDMVVDPSIIFAHDTSYRNPVGFLNDTPENLLTKKQSTQNTVPSGFSVYHGELSEGSELKIISVSGMAESKELLQAFADKVREKDYFTRKKAYNESLARGLTDVISSGTGNVLFDEYARQTYLDNLIRGGHPVKIGDKVIHLYSRKHGDIERDYNYFRLSPEYYSQGNGNFRDVNQNRRNDVRFHPFVKDTNIKGFCNLIQMDGSNPLSVQSTTYRMSGTEWVKDQVADRHLEKLEEFLKKEFSPGQLLRFIEKEQIELKGTEGDFLEKIIEKAEEIQNAEFSEGYWTDHFVYNLDQIEAYLSIFPEKAEELLFKDRTYTYFSQNAHVLPRHERYVETAKGIRQYHSIVELEHDKAEDRRLRTDFGKGEIYHSSLMEKLLVILAAKFSTLDPDGRGIEMEAGKPGWYDALNGLPGIFGSSVADACELLRMMKFMGEAMNAYDREIKLPREAYDLLMGIDNVLKARQEDKRTKFQVWDQLNCLKETYREKIRQGIHGEERTILSLEFGESLKLFISYLNEGIEEAVDENNGICPTYYYREVAEYEKKEGRIIPKSFRRIDLPIFLEGPVKYLKLMSGWKEKREAYEKVRMSPLYDRKLQMYKVNASLKEVTFELGRAKAFTPGWLENESIWLHMEYKYLLELLKNDLHEEFQKDFKTMCIPFLDFKVYGRSLLENSSFIASSANPDEKIHGKGYVARLSGSTAEFLEIWQHMMFGKRFFKESDGELTLSFSPSIPDYLITETLNIDTTFLGKTPMSYHLSSRKSLIPGQYSIREIILTDYEGQKKSYNGAVQGEEAEQVREGKVRRIDVYIEN